MEYFPPQSSSVVGFVPVVSGPVRPQKAEEETGGVLGAQLLTVLSVGRVESYYVCSGEIHIHQKPPSTL